MKAPSWGMCCTVAVLAAVLAMVMLQSGTGLSAADPPGPGAIGPNVGALARANDGSLIATNPTGLSYYAPSPAFTPPNSLVNLPNNVPPAADGISTNEPPSSTATGSATNRSGLAPSRFPDDHNLALISDPLHGAPSNAALGGGTVGNTADAAPAKNKSNSWHPIQAAFRQLTDTKTDDSPPAPAADVLPSRPNVSSPGLADPGMPIRSAPRLPSSSVLSAPPGMMPPGSVHVEPSNYPQGAAPMVPSGVVYEGSSGPPPGSGCGCNGGAGGGCPDLPEGQAACPNCGGWKPCSCCTNDPEGSTVLQRLACRLSRPWPDCSNGCIDFCHSWLFHEDDCWFTSNHKCPAPGCGPWPYGSCATDGQGKGNGCGCGNCGYCIPPPDLYFSAEAMALTRDNEARSQNVVLNGTAGAGPQVLKADQLGFDWSVGPSFILGYRPTPKDFWELTYFGLQDFKDTESPAVSPLTVPSDLGMDAATAFANASQIDVTYTSRINNAEVNYYWYPGSQRQLSLLSGFRYFSLDERFELNAIETGVVQSFYDIHSVNNLYGWQLGARWNQSGDRFGYAITGKAGAFGNDGNEQQMIGNVGDPALIRPAPGMLGVSPAGIASTDETHWAFVSQVDLTVTYRIAKGWEATAGYNAMWLEGVALAPDQLDFTLNLRSGSTMHADGELFMHGGHAGLAYRW